MIEYKMIDGQPKQILDLAQEKYTLDATGAFCQIPVKEGIGEKISDVFLYSVLAPFLVSQTMILPLLFVSGDLPWQK